MDNDEIRMHLAAGRYYGKESTCFNRATGEPKMVLLEQSAIKVAASLNRKKSRFEEVEPYPCYFCSERFPETAEEEQDFVHLNWHVGRKMTDSERKLFSESATKILEMETVTLNATEPSYGIQRGEVQLRVHSRKLCSGRNCSIHNPSDHHMKDWPLNWRADTRVMERICPHGNGHPDPDHMTYVLSLTPEHDCPDIDECSYPHMEYQSIHGCHKNPLTGKFCCVN